MKKTNLSPTKKALLEKWKKGKVQDNNTTIPKRPKDSLTPLSFPQQRQLFLELLDQGTAVNNLSVMLEIKGKLDIEALNKSANKMIARHDILRTCFPIGMGLPTPEILPELTIQIPVVELQQIESALKENKARSLAEQEVLITFDLFKAPLIRLRLYRLEPEKHFLLVVAHHIISDGWSLGVFLRELLTIYQAITTHQTPFPPELPIQYADYAYYQQKNQLSAQEPSMQYWKDQLKGELPVLSLPTDRQRRARQTFSGGTYRFTLSENLSQLIEKLSRQANATNFMTLLTAFNILLCRYSGQQDILVGTPVANRTLPEVEPLIGLFINTLVLRTDLSGNPTFGTLLRQVRNIALDAYAHQDLPFEKLVEELKPTRDLSRTPIFQVVFNLQNSPLPKLDLPGLAIKIQEVDRGVSQFDLSLIMTKSAEQWHGTVEYNNDLFESATIARMFQSFQVLLTNATTYPDTPISILELVPSEVNNHLLKTINHTEVPFPREKSIHQLVEEQVIQTPDAVAVVFDQSKWTYKALDEYAHKLSGYLHPLGVGPGIRVGVLMRRSMKMVGALLGILKAGGTYVPLTPEFPAERIRFMLKEANVTALLTNENTTVPKEWNLTVVNLDDPIPESSKSYLTKKATPEDLAYIIFTSGSTGLPKGVMISHAALTNFIWSMKQQLDLRKDDVLMAVTSLSFDISALEIFLPLIVGATVVIGSKETIKNPFLLEQAINEHEVTIMQATPASWQLLVESGWKGKKELKTLCGGDVLTRKLANQLLDRIDCLWNMYGPTETTIWSSINPIEGRAVPIIIGRPIGNTQLYILDEHLQLTPIGVIGELHIGGEGLARGYLNSPELTQKKFIPNPFSKEPNSRLYKTGDLARYLPDFSIELLGRTDNQVKINGYRIELEEIATVLRQHPAVQDAIISVNKENPGTKRLIAYLIPNKRYTSTVEELKQLLVKKLPPYMIPSSFIQLAQFPLTPNGKVDRKALPSPQIKPQPQGYVGPRNKEEQLLADIWQDVLDLEQVGIHDNFFDLGGASIQSLQIVAIANMSGIRLSVESIFEHQTIAELAKQVNKN